MVEKDAVADKAVTLKQQWAWLASEDCRVKGRTMAITLSQTLNATQHMGSLYIKSTRSIVPEST